MNGRASSGASPHALIILLHGFGSSGQSWDHLISLWRLHLPHTEFVAPNGPFTCEKGGFRWFEEESKEGGHSRKSSAAFDTIIARTLATHRFEDCLDRVSLVGFSEGASMALDALARGRWPVASVVGFAGRLPSLTSIRPPSGTALLLIDGDNDPVVPQTEGRRAADMFRRYHIRVERHVVDAIGHGISRGAAEIGKKFLQETLFEEYL